MTTAQPTRGPECSTADDSDAEPVLTEEVAGTAVAEDGGESTETVAGDFDGVIVAQANNTGRDEGESNASMSVTTKAEETGHAGSDAQEEIITAKGSDDQHAPRESSEKPPLPDDASIVSHDVDTSSTPEIPAARGDGVDETETVFVLNAEGSSAQSCTDRQDTGGETVTSEKAMQDDVNERKGSTLSVPATTSKKPSISGSSSTCQDKNAVASMLSLPLDSLHSIASFLTPAEWNEFGRVSKSSRRVCREIIRRVRMHGFRCATEIVTAWKLGQHADGKELAALYTRSGVPVYPRSLGHTYHTIAWRMMLEINEIEEKERQRAEQRDVNDDSIDGSAQSSAGAAGANPNNSGASATDPSDGGTELTSTVDSFFRERSEFRSRENYGTNLTYVTEKCLYWIDKKGDDAGIRGEGVLASFRSSIRSPSPVGEPRAGDVSASIRSASSAADAAAAAVSASLTPPPNFARKIPLKVHQHLLHQHKLGKNFVDDRYGKMLTPQVNLSADFYHPSSQHIAPKVTAAPNNKWSSLPSSLVSPHGLVDRDSVQNSEDGDAAPARDFVDDPPPVVLPQDPAIADLEGEGVARVALPDFLEQQELRLENDSTLFEPTSPLSQEKVDSVLRCVELESYSSTFTASSKKDASDETHVELKRHLRSRFATYQRRLEAFLTHSDHSGFDECILDFWDEFFPQSSGIHYYDRHTPVPRISCLQKFLTKPCPKAIGIVQCEIERIKITPKGKGVNVKGRLFPTYEYRLFIRNRPQNSDSNDNANSNDDETPAIRRDTVLMVAKNRGRKHAESSRVAPTSLSSKKGSNNYYLYMPQQSDVDGHFNKVNETEKPAMLNPNGASNDPVIMSEASGSILLGRLQSNFIGTEFQIFTPRVMQKPHRQKPSQILECHGGSQCSPSDDELDYDSGMSSDNTTSRRSRFSRLSLRRSGNAATPESPSLERHSRSRAVVTRTVSCPELPQARQTRTNRRAIADNTPETQQQQQSSSQPLPHQPLEPSLYEAEDGAITYTANLLGSRPRIMDVCIPKVTPDGEAGREWKRYVDACDDTDETGMLNCFRQLQQRLSEDNAPPNQPAPADDELHRESELSDAMGSSGEINNGDDRPTDFGLMALQNRPPWWNIELGSFVLNFGGRVSVASVKNFQLCDRNDHDRIMLQFGRIQGRHSFTMDFMHPLSAVQAFSIAISSLQSKISFG